MKRFAIGAFSMFMMMGLGLTAYAEDGELTSQARSIENVTESVEENAARITGTPRGMMISSVELSITDLGGGTAELFGEVLCHQAMEKIKMNLYLDQWIPEDNDWAQLKKFELEWLAEDYPDEELTMAYAYVDVPNLDRGENYRIRGIVGAWDLDSDLYEVWSEASPSILVE
ncbi:MAG: hypothetical protein ACI39W_05890 [Brotaphodocola sp.]